MNTQLKEKKFTVQGADPPVPVGVGGVGTGHPRPSASDSPDPQVAHQAGEMKRVTGGKEHSDDGSGEDKGKRTTETRRLSSTPNMVTIDLRREDCSPGKSLKHSRLNMVSQLRRCNSFDTGKKRKVMDTSIDSSDAGEDIIKRSEDPIAFVIMEALETIMKCSQDLDKRIVDIPNTKREIKDVVIKLKKNVDVLRRETSKSWFEKHKWTHIPIPTYDVECQTDFPDLVPTQANERHTRDETEHIVNQIRNNLGRALSYDQLKSFLDLRWPTTIFTKCELETSDSPEYSKGCNNVLIYKGEGENDQTPVKRFLKANPIIESSLLKGETCNPILGQCTVSELLGNQQGKPMREKAFSFLIRLKGDDEAEDDIRLNEALRTISEAISGTQTSDIVCLTTLNSWETRIRKHLEHAFTGYASRVVLRVKKKEINSQRNSRRLPPRNNSLIVKAGERSYSDLLKEVRSKVQVDKIGVGIKRARKTAAGDLLITVRGSSDKLKTLNKEVTEKIAGITTMMKDTEDIFIYNVDEAATEEEIRAVLKQTLKATEEETHTTSVRFLPVNKYGGRTVVLNLNERLAREACGLGKLKIGWTSCRVKMKVTINRCFRCLETGHTAGRCNGQDRRNACLRCSREGHKAKECNDTPRCLDCQSEGHSLNSLACPRLSGLLDVGRAGGRTRRPSNQQ